jgi:hypothetical protein
VLIGWHLDPWVLVPSEPCLDACDVGYLIVHCPSGTLGRVREVGIAAAAGKVDHGLGGLGEGFDEVVQALRLCRVWRHGVSLLRVCT